jgi:PAS domain S-box-containing protein
MEKNKIKILAIDDIKDNLISLKALTQEAFPDSITLMAVNGAAGIQLAQSEDPDVILLDVVMPGMDGFEVCQKLKANPKTHDIPVVFLTALKGDKQGRIRALEVGAEAFLAKPIDEPELAAQIRAMQKIKNASNQKKEEKEVLARLVAEQTRELKQTQIATLNLLEDLHEENEARKKKEDALRKSEAALKKAQQVAHVGSWAWHIHQNRLEWSDEMYRIFGMDPQTFSGDLADVIARTIHPDDRAALEQASRIVVEDKKPVPMEYRILWQDGTVRTVWAEAGGLLLDEEGSPDVLAGTVQDITERRQAEEQLRLQATALQAAANAILITSREGTIEWVNPAYSLLTGYSAHEVIGQNPRILKSGLQDQGYYEKLWETILAGKVWRGELVNRRKDGSLYTEEETITPLHSTSGQVEHFIGIKVDITERKQQEAEILKNNQDMNLLYQAGKQLSQSLDLERVYLSFYKLISSTMQCGVLFIADYDSQNEMIRAKFAVMEGKTVDVSAIPAIPLEPEGYGIQSPVIRSGKSRIINNYGDALKQTNTNYYVDAAGITGERETYPDDEPITQSSLIVPIQLNNQVTGVVQIQSFEKDAYTAENLKIAEAVVSQIAVAANNAKLYQQSLNEIKARYQAEASLRNHAQRQEKMASLGRELAATLNLDVIYRTAESYLKEMIDCPNFGITLFDSNQIDLKAAYVSSDGMRLDVNLLPPLKYDAQHSTSGRWEAISSQAPVIVRDLEARRKTSGGMLVGSDQEPQSAIYVPMLSDGKVIGLLDFQSYQQAAYTEEDGKWLSVVANQIGMTIQNARLYARMQQRNAELSAMHAIDSAVSAHLDPEKIFEVLLDQIVTRLGVDAVDVLLFNPKTQFLEYASGRGFLTPEVEKIRFRLGEGLAGQAALEERIVQINYLPEENESFLNKGVWAGEAFRVYFGVPLLANARLIGVLEVIHRSSVSADADWLRFLELLAGQAAIVIETIQLYEDVQHANRELLKAYDATIEGWSQAMDLRDKETEGHTRRVTNVTLRLAREFGLGEDALVQIRRGALLHDIGKLGVPDDILRKPGQLTADEWAVMKKHPGYAYHMLDSIEYLRPALEIPFCHHEKWDGSGYPRGLKGEEIPLAARLFAIVDVWDALTSDRPYRKAWPCERVLAYLREQSGKHFDPQVVDAFMDLADKGLGIKDSPE